MNLEQIITSLLQEDDQPKLFYLQFIDTDAETGHKMIGGTILPSCCEICAVQLSWVKGINMGHRVICSRAANEIPESFQGRILKLQEIDELSRLLSPAQGNG